MDGIIDLDSAASPPKVRKARISEVWRFFKKTGRKAKCTHCGKEYAHCGNTSNLKDHISRCNSIRSSSRSTNSTNSSSSGGLSDTSTSQNSIASFFKGTTIKYDKNSSRKKDLDHALALMISQDFQPFSIVEDTGFRNLLRMLDPRYELPCRTTVRNKLLETQYYDIKNKVKSELDGIMHLVITCDMWSSRANDAYITVTGHFINKDFELKCYVLSTKLLADHTNKKADNMAQTMQSVFDEYQIRNKIVCIVTDNDNTITKMCSNLQIRNLPCVAHSINLLVQDTLQLNDVDKILAKCKRIVRFFKSSNIANAKLIQNQNCDHPLKLLQEVPTRWNSALSMIKRILEIKTSINSCLLEIEKAPEVLRNEEALILNYLVALLEPFEDATKQVSSSKNVTISLINPLICGLFLTIHAMKDKLTTPLGKEAANFILAKMQIRLAFYETRTITRISTLDARFKKEGFRQTSNAEEAVKYLDTEIIIQNVHMRKEFYENSEDCDVNENEMSPQNLLGFMSKRRKKRTDNADAIITRRQYLEQQNCDTKTDPLLYWKVNGKQTDVLAELARKFLCIPASSVESERTFSTAGLMVTDRRVSLKPDCVDMLVFLNKNLSLDK